jgi:WD40 repeat protein
MLNDQCPMTKDQGRSNSQCSTHIGAWTLGFVWSLVIGHWSLLPSAAVAQEKVTYQDHVLPLVETHCSKCHNPDKLKGDLDLTSFNGVMKGGGSGVVVAAGNPDSSKLWKAITHAEEPTMPPNKPKLADKDLEVFRKWIASGLLENSGSKAIAGSKPAVDLSLKGAAPGKPEGPPPMPKDFSLDPVLHTGRGNPITGLAASPWAPLVAIAGQKQVFLYGTDELDLMGILPFTNGQPVELKFSRNAKLLLASGGHAAKGGKVVIWDITTGEQIAAVGEEQDTVLTADISPDQTLVALGGPSRFLKIYSTKTGELLHKIKKHTDWVTAVAFSPNGELLASADRNGGISIWEPDNGQELFTLAGHKSFVTGLNWRDDSMLLASSSEDGTIKWWDMSEGKQAKSWNAHSGGTLAVTYAHDGQLVSCGRDNAVTLWKPDTSKERSFEFFGELPLRAAISHDTGKVIAADFGGRVAVWNLKDGKRIRELETNPLPLSERLKAAEQKLQELQKQGDKPSPEFAAAQAKLTEAQSALLNASNGLQKAQAEQKQKEDAVVKLKEEAANAPQTLLTQVYPPPEIEVKLKDAREVRAKAREGTTNALQAIETKQKEFQSAEAKVKELKAREPAAVIPGVRAEISRLKAAIVQSDLFRARNSVTSLRREHDRLQAVLAEKQSSLKTANEKLASTEQAEAKNQLKEEIKTIRSELEAAESAVKKIAAEIASQEQRIGTLSAEFNRLKNTSST